MDLVLNPMCGDESRHGARTLYADLIDDLFFLKDPFTRLCINKQENRVTSLQARGAVSRTADCRMRLLETFS